LISSRTMPWLVSVRSATCAGSTGEWKLGQPVPELNLCSLEKSGRPHTTHA